MDTKRDNLNRSNPLAFRIYPPPNGTEYWENDLSNERDVEDLFDYAQILEAIIYKKGWEYLINKYGYEILFEINQRSGWIDCDTIEEFKLRVEYEMSWENDHAT